MSQAQATAVPARPPINELSKVEMEAAALQPWPAFLPEDIQAGDPAHSGTVLYRDPSGRFSVGVWQCPPSRFKVAYAGTEVGNVLQGRARLTDLKSGRVIEIKAGDRFVSPHGSTVIWEVLETFKKFYCMYEDAWDAERFY